MGLGHCNSIAGSAWALRIRITRFEVCMNMSTGEIYNLILQSSHAVFPPLMQLAAGCLFNSCILTRHMQCSRVIPKLSTFMILQTRCIAAAMLVARPPFKHEQGLHQVF